MEKKLLFLDLDGTLLNDRKQITSENRMALESALQRGHGVIIATGRTLSSAARQAKELGLDRPGCYLIAYNGAVIYDWGQNRSIFSRTLPISTVCRVFAYMNRHGIHIQTYDSRNVLVEGRCDNDLVRRYCSLTGMDYQVIADVQTGLQEEPVKLLAIDYADPACLRDAQQWIQKELAGEADCFFSCNEYLEIVPPGINKGQAVKRMCRLLDVPAEHTVAVGDAANDLPMICAAGVGVAMANGTGEVKEAADYVTQRDNNHDAIAEVITRFLA